MEKNIVVYGSVDKRPIILGLLKLLQGFGDVLLITREHHYARLTTEKEDVGYFQNVLISTLPESPDEIFDYLQVKPSEFDFIIWDCDYFLPNCKIDIAYAVYSYEDALLYDDIYDIIPNPYRVKLKYDGKNTQGDYNINITMKLVKYVELAEAFAILEPFKFRDISKLFSDTLAEMLDAPAKTIVKYLELGGR